MPDNTGMFAFVTKTPEERMKMLEALEDAMSSGVYSIQHEGKTVTFRGDADMQRTHARLCRSLGIDPDAGSPKRPRILRGVLRTR